MLMTSQAESKLLAILQEDLSAQRRERASDRKITRELLELLRDQRDVNREMLELMRLVRQDLTKRKEDWK
jgi:hypothetical protein